MRSKLFLGALLASAAAACLSPTGMCACPPALGLADLSGAVTRAGRPVRGAVVRVDLRARGCADTTRSTLVDRPETTADTLGRYTYQARSAAPSDTACVRVTAVDTSGGRRDSAVATAPRVRLTSSHGTRERPPVIRLDVALR